MFHIVLVEPQIPPNTGNIARLTAAMECTLHLVKPMGFVLEDRYLKRAGLDYWPHVKLNVHESLQDLWNLFPQNRFFYFTTKSQKAYTHQQYNPGDFLVFGSETRGLSPDILEQNKEYALTIPMTGKVRSLNLSTAVAMVLGEALRQN